MSFLTSDLAKKPYLIGLTGNIGSGKSTAARFFEEEGIPSISSDAIVHKLYNSDKDLQEFLIKEYGSLDRKVIAGQIFGEKEEQREKRRLLEEKVHPLVEKKLKEWVIENANSPILVNDVPLLFEAHLEKRFDSIVFIQVDKAVQIERLKKRNPEMSEDDILNRINSQMSQEEKISKSDIIIPNNSSLQEFKAEILILIKKLINQKKK
ncbi:MAG: dephospho-CoA kinase [Candidatus Melainabacteria bacterium]|nr:dephospho-CoA kinase [Candidatus Melainabacteria bacterium]